MPSDSRGTTHCDFLSNVTNIGWVTGTARNPQFCQKLLEMRRLASLIGQFIELCGKGLVVARQFS
jgi:hypothetical protein